MNVSFVVSELCNSKAETESEPNRTEPIHLTESLYLWKHFKNRNFRFKPVKNPSCEPHLQTLERWRGGTKQCDTKWYLTQLLTTMRVCRYLANSLCDYVCLSVCLFLWRMFCRLQGPSKKKSCVATRHMILFVATSTRHDYAIGFQVDPASAPVPTPEQWHMFEIPCVPCGLALCLYKFEAGAVNYLPRGARRLYLLSAVHIGAVTLALVHLHFVLSVGRDATLTSVKHCQGQCCVDCCCCRCCQSATVARTALWSDWMAANWMMQDGNICFADIAAAMRKTFAANVQCKAIVSGWMNDWLSPCKATTEQDAKRLSVRSIIIIIAMHIDDVSWARRACAWRWQSFVTGIVRRWASVSQSTSFWSTRVNWSYPADPLVCTIFYFFLLRIVRLISDRTRKQSCRHFTTRWARNILLPSE